MEVHVSPRIETENLWDQVNNLPLIAAGERLFTRLLSATHTWEITIGIRAIKLRVLLVTIDTS